MQNYTKSDYYNELKASGFEFDKIYREYTLAEMKALYEQHFQEPVDWLEPDLTEPTDPGFSEAQLKYVESLNEPTPTPAEGPVKRIAPPVPDELSGSAGLKALEQDADEVVEVDEDGREWLQLEVRKPAFPKPRGRRVVQYIDSGVRTEQVQDGDYIESFEVPGNARAAHEVKITLPSHQVGIFRDRRFPFKIMTYNSNSGFDYDEVNAYYGGAELVPDTVKRKYVSNRLAYDIRSVINAIRDEARQLQLRRI